MSVGAVARMQYFVRWLPIVTNHIRCRCCTFLSCLVATPRFRAGPLMTLCVGFLQHPLLLPLVLMNDSEGKACYRFIIIINISCVTIHMDVFRITSRRGIMFVPSYRSSRILAAQQRPQRGQFRGQRFQQDMNVAAGERGSVQIRESIPEALLERGENQFVAPGPTALRERERRLLSEYDARWVPVVWYPYAQTQRQDLLYAQSLQHLNPKLRRLYLYLHICIGIVTAIRNLYIM